jgi:chorismate mutase
MNLDKIRLEIDNLDKNIVLLIVWQFEWELWNYNNIEETQKTVNWISIICNNINILILTKLLSKRFYLIDTVLEYKIENNIEIEQIWRFEQLLNNLKEFWKQYSLSWEKIEKIWSIIHNYSVEYQNKKINIISLKKRKIW